MKHVMLIIAAAGFNCIVVHAAARTISPTPPPAPPGFAKCQGCHATIAGTTARAGPVLWGVVGARAGSRADYAYSSALKASRIVWTRATLSRYLADPAAAVPGTRMPKVAMSPAERGAFVDYLTVLK